MYRARGSSFPKHTYSGRPRNNRNFVAGPDVREVFYFSRTFLKLMLPPSSKVTSKPAKIIPKFFSTIFYLNATQKIRRIKTRALTRGKLGSNKGDMCRATCVRQRSIFLPDIMSGRDIFQPHIKSLLPDIVRCPAFIS